MYKKVGDIFKYQNITLQVIECNTININGCEDCYFFENFGPCGTILCNHIERKDLKSVIFKQIK